jgi:xanthine dehydrogenase accessory factor
MKLSLLSDLNSESAIRRTCVLVTDVASGDQRLIHESELENDPLLKALQETLRQGGAGIVEHDGRQFFLTVHAPPVRLIVIGAVHVAQELAPMARELDFDITIIEPRTAFATSERFPDLPMRAAWPDVALQEIGIDGHTAVVALTHDPKIDDPALVAALRSPCFYIGALGSYGAHHFRVGRLKAFSFAE